MDHAHRTMLSMSPTTPRPPQSQSLSYASSPAGQRTFKRAASSDDDLGHGDFNDGSVPPQHRRNGSSAKRACNECRQQKLRCTVVREDPEKGIPFQPCARCVKQKLTCVIHDGFKRVGKRSRNAAMEKEMSELKEKLAAYEQGILPPPVPQPTLNTPLPTSEPHAFPARFAPAEEDDSYLQSQHQQVAASSLLDLRSGSPMVHSTLGDVRLPPAQVNELFEEFFASYHPFLPFLDVTRTPDEYAKDNRLLFWAILSVAARHYDQDPRLLIRLKEPLTTLIWQTVMGSQPNHHVVKALCLLCTWPLPTNRTSTDPTFMFCGLMMQMAMQIGLHQPASAQDFSRTKVRVRQEDVHDRLRTWAVCNIVAQTVSTGHGQPSITLYDSTLEFRMDDEEHMKVVPPNLFIRLRQEMAASRITKLLYSSSTDDPSKSTGATSAQKLFYMNLEANRLQEEQGSLDGVDKELEALHHGAVYLHLRLYAFFNPDVRLGHRNDLLDLYFAAISFLDQAFNLQKQNRLKYAPYYIMQMVLAAGCALLKLLNSDFATNLPFEQGRQYVVRTIDAMRKSKVVPNDLHDRFAEVLAQLWHEGSSGRSLHSTSQSPVISNPTMAMYNNANTQAQLQQREASRRGSAGSMDEPLRLRLRSRMSMSVVFDCIQRWRESKATGAAEALDNTVVNNPTNPDSSSNSPPPGQVAINGKYENAGNVTNGDIAVSSAAGIMENPTHGLPGFNPHLNTLSMPLTLPNGLGGIANANSFEIFDPVSWYLDSHQPDWGQGGFGGGFGNEGFN